MLYPQKENFACERDTFRWEKLYILIEHMLFSICYGRMYANKQEKQLERVYFYLFKDEKIASLEG